MLVFLAGARAGAQSNPTGIHFVDQSSVVLMANGHSSKLHIGDHLDNWTLMQVVKTTAHPPVKYAVLEDFAQLDGRLVFADTSGVKLALSKTSEPTSGSPAKFYLGHEIGEVMSSPTDLLGEEILAKSGDPDYGEIAAAFPPIRKISSYSFLGTPSNVDKIGFAYGGRTANFDPAPYYPPIAEIRDKGQVREGLVGGYLPILRFVYPESEGNWSEVIAFAPFRTSNGNDHIQPVWYRIARIENHRLKWIRYIDSYHPFPPRTDYDPSIFYADLWQLNSGWKEMLQPAMKIDLPDDRVANMAGFALVREMMTRVNDFPKYGAVDKDYAGSEHDGFPDTFTVDTTAMIEWGLTDLAGGYIDNYFGKFVRDDGSLLYRGPETGQYGRMLTVAAQYVDNGGDPAVLLRNRRRIDGVTKLLLGLRAGENILPAIAGVKEPFHVAVSKDKSDPQFRSYRAYMEMMYSGNLTEDQVKMIVSYRSHHHDVILGMPTAYGFNTGILAGFLSYGYGYGLIQHDLIREALLTMYSDMAHQYTRGTWTAPETRSILPDEGAAPYCTPAQLVVALMTKWLLVFEDPQSETLWLGKGIPRKWLQDGKKISVAAAPTRWGRVDFTIASHLASGKIRAQLNVPQNFVALTKVRLRAPNNAALKSVTLNGKPWSNFDASTETITIPNGVSGNVNIVARY